MASNFFLNQLSMEDHDDTAGETVEETTTTVTEQTPVHNTEGAQDKKVPGSGATTPGAASVNAEEITPDNQPKDDITEGGVEGGEGEETDRVNENTIENPDYVDPEAGDQGDQGATEEPEPIDTNEGTEEPSDITPGEGTSDEGDEVGDVDTEVTEDTIIEDVEPEEVAEVSEDEEEEAEDAIDEVTDEAEEQEEEDEDLEEAAEEAEDLAESNEAWLDIMQHAVKNDAVTLQLKAGFETYLKHVESVLGEASHVHIHSLEAFEDDHEMYCQQAIASLEGISDTIERAYERIVQGMSQRFHFVSDALTQKKTYGKLLSMADAALNRIAASSETSKELKTSDQTRELSIAGNLISNVAKGVATHVKSMEGIFNEFIPKSLGNIDKIAAAVQECENKSWKEMDQIVKPLKNVPLASSYLRPEWQSGKGFLGCIALRGGDGHVAQNGSFYRYARSRQAAGMPKWINLDDVPQRTKLTVTKADAQAALKLIRQHCSNMVAAHGKLKVMQDKTVSKGSLIRKILVGGSLENNIRKIGRFKNAVFNMANAEVGYFIRPARKAIYQDVRVLRGVIKFLNRF